jgi:glycerophosphoryl diester phosphodiesterase
MSPPLLLGHRGARATRAIPENTLESFDLALALGCDGFEFDVRLTADQRCVVCHDPVIAGCEVSRAGASDLTQLAELHSVLDRYSERAFLDIELKVPGLEAAVARSLKSYHFHRGYVVSSFLPEVLQTMRAHDPAIPLGLICENPSQLALWQTQPVQCVIPHHTLVDGDLVKTLHQERKQVLVWTVNRREAMLRLSEMKVDGIISDETELLVKVLRAES